LLNGKKLQKRKRLRAGTVYINGNGVDPGELLSEDINNQEMAEKVEFEVYKSFLKLKL